MSVGGLELYISWIIKEAIKEEKKTVIWELLL